METELGVELVGSKQYTTYYITALANCRHVIAKCGYVTGGLYITSSGAVTAHINASKPKLIECYITKILS